MASDGPAPTTLPPSMALPPPPPELPTLAFPGVEQHRLDNGLDVVVSARPDAPLTTVALTVGACSERDPGAGRLVAHAVTAGGAGRYSASQLRQHLAAEGTDFDVEIGVDAVSWSLTVLPERIAFAIEALAAIARQPQWVYAEFARVRDQQMQRAQELVHHDGTWPALQLLYRELFPSPHPYHTYDATADQLAHVNLAACQSWHRRHVRPDNASIVVVGPNASAEVVELVEKHLGSWKASGEPTDARTALAVPSQSDEFVLHLVDQDQSDRAQLLVGWVVPGDGTEDHAIVRQSVRLLCGPRGRFVATGTERISHCQVTTYQGDVGLALVGVTTTPRRVSATVKRLMAALRRLQSESATEDALLGSARDLLGSTPRRWESSRGLAHELARLSLLGAPPNAREAEARVWKSVDATRIQETFRRYLSLELGVFAVTADASKVANSLSKLAPVAMHPASDLETTRRLPKVD